MNRRALNREADGDHPGDNKFALQAGDYGREFLSGCQQLRRPMFFEQFEIGAAFTGAVQKDHQRPFLVRTLLIALGLAQQVAIIDLDDKITAV